MALRFSPALRNFIATVGSWKDFLDEGTLKIYTGAQPATADLAPTGTLLVTITSGGGAKTAEVRAQGTVTLNTGASGSVDTLTVDGNEVMGSATAFNTSLTQTAADVALKINRNPKNKLVVASSAGAVITLTAVHGLGALANGWVVASTATTITKTDVNIGTTTLGVSAVNGLKMDYNISAGNFTKDATQTWSGTAAATGTAGWFRYEGSIVDSLALDSASPPVYLRMDGSIATSGADLNMSSTSITSGAVQTVSTFSLTIPAA